jgi:hypothetical protein
MPKTFTPLEAKKGKTFFAKYLGPTNSRGSRIKVTSLCQRDRSKTMTVAWNHAFDEQNYIIAFAAFLEKHESFFFDRREGETFEIIKAGHYCGSFFTVRVNR